MIAAFIPFTVVAIGDGLLFRNAITEYYPVALTASGEFKEVFAFLQLHNFVNGEIFTETEHLVKEAGTAWLSLDGCATTQRIFRGYHMFKLYPWVFDFAENS